MKIKTGNQNTNKIFNVFGMKSEK